MQADMSPSHSTKISGPDPIEPKSNVEWTPPQRRLLVVLVIALVAVLGAGIALHQVLTASLPQLEGTQSLVGLKDEVTVERDALGIPTIQGSNRIDVARALGFVHAQDRYFQMDLLRRRSAGELAELFGKSALPLDREARVHRFRSRAAVVLGTLEEPELVIAEAYSEGVNGGLEALGSKPIEYYALGVEPQPWSSADSILVVYSMYLDLNDENAARDSAAGLIYDLLGPEMYEFLAPLGTSWDAPIDATGFDQPAIPRPKDYDLRSNDSTDARLEPLPEVVFEAALQPAQGSNNWAVAGSHSAHGGALLANDMHLGLGVPNIWYRAALKFPDPRNLDEVLTVTGVTLPGVPFIIAGSNERIAWGFTNSYGDWQDLVIIDSITETDRPGTPPRYLTPDGPREFEIFEEIIEINGGESVTLQVEETIWGPIIDRDYLGRRRALRWIAHDPQGITFAYRELELASSLEEAIEAANRIGAPPQNMVIATASGRIGWTIMGSIPRRFGHDGRLPTSWADGKRGWDGWLAPAEYPEILDPPSGRLWTANARAVGGEMMRAIGSGNYPLGARARQIRDSLDAGTEFSEIDLLQIQLDDRALFLQRWQELLLEVLSPQALRDDPRRTQLKEFVVSWGGHAAVGSVGYRMVRAYRTFVTAQVLGSITAACTAADDRFRVRSLLQREGPVWQLVSERPQHLLSPGYTSWDEALLAPVDELLDYFLADGSTLADKTWGDRNTVRLRHPMSRFIPGSERWLDMPSRQLPGDSHMPRFQSPFEGASQRFVVSPGREAEGIFHMPAGQSGHPLSPHYSDGHAAWANGEPTPFLPGKTVHRLTLLPR